MLNEGEQTLVCFLNKMCVLKMIIHFITQIRTKVKYIELLCLGHSFCLYKLQDYSLHSPGLHGFLLSLLIISAFYFYNYNIVSRETILFKTKVCYKKILNTLRAYKELVAVSVLFSFLIMVYAPMINSRIDEDLTASDNFLNNSAINDRIFYNNVSRETISNNLIFGSGVGTFIFQIDNYLQSNNISRELQPWQYQPAHSIYFLIASEIGIVGLVLFLLFVMNVLCNLLLRNFNISAKCKRHYIMSLTEKLLYICRKFKMLISGKNNVSRETLLKNYFFLDKRKSGGVCEKSRDCSLTMQDNIVSRETFDNYLNIYLIAILIAFLFIGLFDHYFWTLQQGRLMFWLVLGLMLSVLDYKE